ncbi:MAG TPA: hypothetical protein VF121_00605, partial [Thermoanaerobaculia bacterium]|nr:hypothetical protein [Thermoanaerobaculia bacterium]
MSLIDEALKRAREQAERESATRRSAASRWVPADPLARKRSRALLWVGLAAGCLLFGVGAGLVASRFSGGREGGERGLPIAEERAADGGADLSPAAGAVLLEETTETTDLSTEPPFPLPGELPPGEPLELVPLPGPEPPPAEVDEVPVEPPQAALAQPVPPPPTPPPDPAPPAAS